MSWTKSILMVACGCCLWVTAAQAQQVTIPLYQCPASLQVSSQSYELKREAVYDGPIEEMGELKPEPVPNNENIEPSFWTYEVSSPAERSLYLKCYYQGTEHYVVLKAQGARRCTFTEGAPTVCGE